MNAITLTQPWATLTTVNINPKTVETRSWRAPQRIIGKRLAIHAAKGFPRWAKETCEEEPFYETLAREGFKSWKDLPLGAVVATCLLTACVEMGTFEAPSTQDLFSWLKRPMYPDAAFGDYAQGRFAWVLDDIVALETPIPAKGALGIWEWKG